MLWCVLHLQNLTFIKFLHNVLIATSHFTTRTHRKAFETLNCKSKYSHLTKQKQKHNLYKKHYSIVA